MAIETDADVVADQRGRGGRAVGVVLADGRELRADLIVSNVNPKLLYTRLVAPEHLDDDIARADRPLPLRLGDLPDERRAVRAAGLHRGAGHRNCSRITRAAS